jgi:acyl-CoA thioester hydrolase
LFNLTGDGMTPLNQITFRVRYSETDQMGVVYYANYLAWFDACRTELFINLGIRYKEMEEKSYFLPVIESNIKYLSPARYDDQVMVAVEVADITGVRVFFNYRVFRGSDNRLVAEASTVHAMTDANGKPKRIPGEVKDALEKAVGLL